MAMLNSITQVLVPGRDMTAEEATEAAHSLASPEVAQEDKLAFLKALSAKGETAGEVTAFAMAFRALARDPGLSQWAPRSIDIVGTGGDNASSFNISTTASIIVAAAGVPVIKHGNRAVTSKSGAADFLTQLGVPQVPPLECLSQSMEALGFCFLFAPAYHPAFKEIMPVRKALAAEGRRSIFNMLGPLINPARPAYELLGVFSAQWVRPLSAALHNLGLKRGMAVCTEMADGTYMDEMSCAGSNRAIGFGEFSGIDAVWSARDLGLAECTAADLKGGTAEENFARLNEIASGGGPRGLIDCISLNAGVALWIAGAADDLRAGTRQARELLCGGAVRTWIARARDFYATIPQQA